MRLLFKQPAFTAIIVLSLALGIGANTMIFTLVNGFLLRPLPYPAADRLAAIWFIPPNAPAQARNVANRQNCLAVRERNTVFEHVSCVWIQSANLSGDESVGSTPELLQGQYTTADINVTLGVEPFLGRWFTQAEVDTDAPVMVISYDLWQRRFSSSRDALGKTIRLDNKTSTVIGVMPQDFYLITPDMKWWAPLTQPPNSLRSPTRIAFLFGRMKTGVSLAQARASMEPLAAALAQEVPETNKGWKILVEDLQSAFTQGAKAPLMTFQGAVALVLLIACANVAGLLLAQGVARQKELAVRSALGSSRWRVVRQLLTESVLLALLGGVLGLVIGWAGLRLFLSAVPQIVGGFPFDLDANVLGFTLVLSILTGLLFGIIPALQTSRPAIIDALRENSRSATSTRTRHKLRSGLVVVQVSLALVLLIGAGLLMKSFLQVTSVPVGYDYTKLTTFQIIFPPAEFVPLTGNVTPSGSPEVEVSPRLALISEQIIDRLKAIPGVQSATAGFAAPLLPGVRVYNFTIDGQPAPPPPDPNAPPGPQGPNAQWLAVMSGWGETLGIPLLRGRQLGNQDSSGGPPVIVINETMAKRYWPTGEALGQRIKIDYYNDPVREIVGIVGDTKQNLRDKEQPAQMYLPFAQLPVLQERRTGSLQGITYVVRTSGDLEAIVPGMRSAAAAIMPAVAASNMRTVAENVSLQTLDQWIYATLLTIFGGIAALLAVVGIYGVMAHSVTQRTSEIGVRVALGASSKDVLRLVLRRGVLLIAIGIVIGGGIALGLTRVIQSVLWNVTATDPLTFGLALVGLSGAGLLACYIPARRALKVDPVIALRAE